MAGSGMSDATSGTGGIPRPDRGSGKLTVLYDERCAFCRRCRDWLVTQPCLVDVELLPAGSAIAAERYADVPWLGEELIAVDERGRVWVGPAAFLTCLWVTARYRPWAYLLARPALAPLAERFFMLVSRRRARWSTWLGRDDPDCSWCDGMRLRWDQ